LIVMPTNTVANVEVSGLFAGHCATCRSRDVELPTRFGFGELPLAGCF
jgi:hypothetical protein